jgi:diaminobutyrate acetyltransferase
MTFSGFQLLRIIPSITEIKSLHLPMTASTKTDQSPVSAPLSGQSATRIRPTSKDDGAALWALARDSGALDLNSPYAYLMMAHWFSQTCMVAEHIAADGSSKTVGFVLGFCPPDQPDTLFVWQVAVDESQRGQGLAARMIRQIIDRAALSQIEATVTPSNAPSNALFRGLAQRYGAAFTTSEVFPATTFPGLPQGVNASHEGEVLYRIGPIPMTDASTSP